MQSARMQLWAAEQEIDDEELVDVGLAIGSYGQNGMYDEIQAPRFDEAAFLTMQHQLQQQVQQQVAFAQIPDAVKRFIVHFHQAVRENNLAEISSAYESGWNKLTEKFYAKTEWPDPDVIAPLVNNDQLFLILYRELYYRHVYSRLSPNVDDRFHSYENSCELFNYLLNSNGPVELELPDQWLWDIIDEFIYQFQSFCVWRAKARAKGDEEANALQGEQVWSCYSVLNVLYSFIQKSRINEHILAVQQGKSAEEITEIVGEYGSKQLYKMLGYFSIVGLLRVHVLLGDYTLALKVMENIELNQKTMLARVTACHVATYYYVGFCYFALRRYPDAIRTFAAILNFTMRMRQYHTRSYQYDQINKTADRMYALFAICTSLSPSRLDDNINTTVKERYSEQFAKMARGGDEALAAYEELFLYACPKFIAVDGEHEPVRTHLALFLADVRTASSVPTLRSFLKLYTRLDASKLAGFLDAPEEDMVQQMMVMKQASRAVTRGTSGSLLDGEPVSTSDLDFVIDVNMVHIAESTIGRRYAGWFIRNTENALRAFDGLRAAPLPIRAAAPAAAPAAPAAPSAPEPRATKSVTWAAPKRTEVAA